MRLRILAVLGATTMATSSVIACGSDDPPGASSAARDAADEPSEASSDGATSADTSVVPRDSAASDTGGDERPPTVRRPFLVGSSMRSARSEARSDWTARGVGASELEPAVARHLASAWLADALEEHASIAAFARFTMMLLSVGAPPELVVLAQRASIDEVAHAQAAFALAARYGSREAGPGRLDVHDALGALSLADLVALTTEEGCIGETLGAALAAEQLAVTADPIVRQILTRIVRDEARHAELAWRFVAWAIGEEARGAPGAAGAADAARHASAQAVAATRAMVIRPAPIDLETWHAHGRLSCAEARAVSEATFRDVVFPCLAQLFAEMPICPSTKESVSRETP